MKHLRVAVTAVAVLGAMIGSDCNIFGKGKAKWTIIAYYDGNCDLDLTKNGTSWVIAEAQEIEKVGSTDNVHVVAMVGSLKTGGQCKYYHLEKHENELPDQLRSPILENLGTKDMSDKTTLKNFITYARQKYPAEHYMLMLKDHGGGWRGAMIDAQNGAGSMMTLPDLASAMDTFHFDIVAFDACLMGMVEVAYELRQRANYLVASQFVTYAGTYGGAEWLGWLAANPNCSPLDLAKKIVEACLNADIAKQFIGQMAVIDLSKLDALASRIGTLGNDLVTASGNHGNEILDAFKKTNSTELDDPAFCDLREFCKQVLQEPNLKLINVLRNDANDVVQAINDAVPLTMTNAVGISRGGLCIHFPWKHEQFDSTNYVALQFRSTNWHAFLSKFIAAVGGGGGGGSQVTISGTVSWPGRGLTSCVAYLDTSHGQNIVGILPTAVNTGNGSYVIQFNLSGGNLEAYIEAWDDVNGNQQIDVGDGLGWWDANNNGDWDDMISIAPGQTIQGANITLRQITGDQPHKRRGWIERMQER